MLYLQEVAMLVVVMAVVSFQVIMFLRVWHKEYGLPYKVVWSLAIVSLPVAGASLYYWFNER